MGIEYLGNKSRLMDFVIGPIVALPGLKTAADIFCGTASVSRALAHQGLRVVANDQLQLCATLAEASLLPDGAPLFTALKSEVRQSHAEPLYNAVLRTLNALPPDDGFFFRTYSPASAATGLGPPRMYLTELNAGKVDAIRARIAQWAPMLSRAERAILLRDLVQAVSSVSNTAGTYGCYLKTWKQRALQPLNLVPEYQERKRVCVHQSHEVRCEDAEVVASDLVDIDVVYLDPPYTKRQYAAYYHLLETLVSGATPTVEGTTGLPRWREKQSAFCYKSRATAALAGLVRRLDVPHIFLSYSEDGHIPHEDILDILGEKGFVRMRELSSQRYRSSALAHRAATVRERLYHVAVT